MNYTTYIANQNVRFFSTTYKRTLISFDAGANWNRITPPVNDTTCVLVSLCMSIGSGCCEQAYSSHSYTCMNSCVCIHRFLLL